jgi:hypothetical protein
MSSQSRHFEEDIVMLFRHVFSSSYFSFDGQFYYETNGTIMGLPLSHLITSVSVMTLMRWCSVGQQIGLCAFFITWMTILSSSLMGRMDSGTSWSPEECPSEYSVLHGDDHTLFLHRDVTGDLMFHWAIRYFVIYPRLALP